MLRIYPVILDWLVWARMLVRLIEQSDRDLARQLQRSSTAVALNVKEGMAADGKSKTHAYRIALREMRESEGAIEIAERLAYIEPISEPDAARQRRIIGTLVRLSKFVKQH